MDSLSKLDIDTQILFFIQLCNDIQIFTSFL